MVGGLNQAVFLNSYFTIVYLSVKMINGKILFYLNNKTEMNVNRIEFKKIPSVSIYIKVEGSQRTVDIYIN